MLEPLHDAVFVEPFETGKTDSGIIYEATPNRGAPQWGKVLAVGPGIVDRKGILQSTIVKKGDTVCFPAYKWTKIKIWDKEVYYGKESDIYCTYEGKTNPSNLKASWQGN